jgi:hypothetical protein
VHTLDGSVAIVGTWGVGIFTDDLALDVRGDFRELLGAGYSSEDATARLIADGTLSDNEQARAGWLALAVTQWKTGHLIDSVRDRVISLIDEGVEDGWGEKEAKRRRAVLEKTRVQLLSPQRAPVRLRPARVAQSPYAAGDILRYTADSGVELAFWAVKAERGSTRTTESVQTLFELLAIGDPKLDSVERLVESDPSVLTSEAGFRSVAYFHFLYPQDATGPPWQLIGHVPYPEGRRAQDGMRIAFAKRIEEHAAGWVAQSNRTGSTRPAIRDLVDLIARLPGPAVAWTIGNAGVNARRLGGYAAEALAAGEVDLGLFAGTLESLAVDERDTAGWVLDGLLCAASHPEVGASREELVEHLGDASKRLLASIDAWWGDRPALDKRPPELDGFMVFGNRVSDTPSAITTHYARISFRNLGDGRYASRRDRARPKRTGKAGTPSA